MSVILSGIRMALALAALTFPTALAHRGNRPVTPVGGIPGLIASNHAGYGYLGTTSEAGASALMDFTCTGDDLRMYVADACRHALRATTFDSARNATRDTLRPLVRQQILDSVFEYLALQKATFSSTRPLGTAAPACVSRESPGRAIASDENLPPIPVFADQIDALRGDRATRASAGRAWRLRAVSSAMETLNLAQALIFYDQLQAVKQTRCQAPVDDDERLYCVDIADKTERIRTGFPVLFSPASDAAAEAQRLLPLRRAIQLLMGTDGAPAGASSQARQSRGEGLYRADLLAHPAATDSYPNTLRRLNTAIDGAVKRSPPNPTLAAAFRDFEQAANALRASRSAGVDSELSALCAKDLGALIRAYPSAVRQSMVDGARGESAAARAVLCESGLLGDFQQNVRNSCLGVTGGPLATAPVRVTRGAADFPLSSATNYTVENRGGRLVVKQDFHFWAGNGVTEAKARHLAQKWVRRATEWYNAQSRKQNPPLAPPVEFQFNLRLSEGSPGFAIHRCYNADLSAPDSTDCTKVAAAGGNREDDSNLTPSSSLGTVRHEFGHGVGLDDEYVEQDYAFNRLGEDNSVMNDSDHRHMRFYRRHFEQIVLPAKRCRR